MAVMVRLDAKGDIPLEMRGGVKGDVEIIEADTEAVGVTV
jgi:hypothetical protein